MLDYILDFYINRQYGMSYIVTEGLFVLAVVIISNRITLTPKGIARVIVHFLGLWAFSILAANGWYYAARNWIPVQVSLDMSKTVLPAVMVLYMVLFSKYKWRTRVVEAVTFYTCFRLILQLTEAVGYILRTEYNIQDMTLWSMMLLTVALIAYLYLFNFDDYEFVPTFSVILKCGYAVLTYLATAFSSGMERQTHIFLLACLLLMELLAYYMFCAISNQYRENVVRQVMHDRKAGARDMLLVSKAGYDNIHVVLHDVKNQLSTLKTLLYSGKYEEAINFLDAFELFASPAIGAVDCGNVVVDSALAVGREKAAQKGLELTPRVAVPPVLNISGSDLVSVICNLIDNAIEACVREQRMDQAITVDIRYRRGYLLLRVENPISGDIPADSRLKLRTSKDAANHGWGTRIVRDIANKYNGIAKFTISDGKFIADVMLAIPE
ncbi:MAG: ATP-binding protein [Faecousia sp.]